MKLEQQNNKGINMSNKMERRDVIYKCSCNGDVKKLRQLQYMRETIVDEDEYCIYCGNAALAKTAYSVAACRGTRKVRSDKKSDRAPRTKGADGVQRGKVYMEEVNIEEFGKTGSGKILSGWKEISRF
jgi:hypothetical protein